MYITLKNKCTIHKFILIGNCVVELKDLLIKWVTHLIISYRDKKMYK